MADEHEPVREARRTALRQIAAQVLATGSRRDLTVLRISDEAGISVDAVRRSAGSLDRLVWEIVARHVNIVLERLHTEAPDGMASADRWAALARTYVAVVGEYAAEHRTTIAYRHHLDERQHGDARILQRYVLQTFIDALRAAAPSCATGRIGPLALSLLAMLNAQAAWFCPGAGMSRDGYADMAARIILAEALRPAD